MKRIKVWFLEYGYDVPDSLIIYIILKKHYLVELNPNPDYLIYRSYSIDFLKYDCVRIHYSGEQESPDFDLHDYDIGCDNLFYGDRYIRFPAYQFEFFGEDSFHLNYSALIKNDNLKIEDIKNRFFCSYLSSNSDNLSDREKFVSALSKYKVVNSGGKSINNIGFIVEDKLDFLSNHKFNIAAENAIHPYYTTEKIYQAFLAKTIPIYIGNPLIGMEFNPKSFINTNDFTNMQEMVDYISKVDLDEELYLEIINQPKITNDSIITKTEDFESFLRNIFDQDISKAKRRPTSQKSTHKVRLLLYSELIYSKLFLRLPKFIRKLFY